MHRIITAIVALAAFTGVTTAAAAEPTDSAAVALATIWSDYLANANTQSPPTDAEAYIGGVADALLSTDADESRMRGIAEGSMMARQLVQMEQMTGLKIDRAAFVAALRSAFAGQPTGFTRTSAESYLDHAAEASARTASEQTARECAQFLAEQAKRPGVTMTPSGLLFEVIADGDGVPPSADDTVDVYYTGTLPDGTVFDATTEGRPATFPVGKTVKGFAEGLQMMKPGGHYRIYIPAALAYGDQGAGGVIPPGSAIAFDVELLNVK